MRLREQVAIGMLSLLLSVRAWAAETSADAPAEDVKKARAVFRQGVELFREGNSEAAVAEFRKAYRLAPSYRILYNIGQAYSELHDYVNALRTLQQYLADGGVDIAPERREEVEAFNEKLASRIARLDIDANIDGAEIRVDDLVLGLSPLPLVVSVNSGARRITAVKSGYRSAVRLVTVAGGDTVKVVLMLEEGAPAPIRYAPSQALIGESQSVKKAPTHSKSRIALTVSVVAAGACAVGAAVFGTLALSAKHDFDKELNTYPTSNSRVDGLRSTMLTYSVLTDAFAAAAVAATGLSAYYLWAGSKTGQSQSRTSKQSIVLMPTLGGMVAEGRW
jgi:hypothetical protein